MVCEGNSFRGFWVRLGFVGGLKEKKVGGWGGLEVLGSCFVYVRRFL